ncbi:MAG: lipopolysaccharide heptosyltransferase II [Phycisphaerae bacterium]
MAATQGDIPQRILVTIPNWVGDVVLATPTLAAIRGHFRTSRITYLMRDYVRDITDGCDWHDDEIYWPKSRGVRVLGATFALARELRARRFDLAILLTNSMRSALTVWLGGAKRRVGYARDGRSWLLTDRLRPLRRDGDYVPASVLPYYAKLAEHVGARVDSLHIRLDVSDEQEQAGQELKRHYGLDAIDYAVINPGAAFGAAKCWPVEHFASLCDRLVDQTQLTPVIIGAPGEAALMRDIAGRAKRSLICCDKPHTTLGSLKVAIRDAKLLVCNDTGPRHYGNVFDVPTVTIFGPTHQEWTDTEYTGEIKLQKKVPCGPCQLRICPLDHRCMTEMTVGDVMSAVRELLARGKRLPIGAPQAEVTR